MVDFDTTVEMAREVEQELFLDEDEMLNSITKVTNEVDLGRMDSWTRDPTLNIDKNDRVFLIRLPESVIRLFKENIGKYAEVGSDSEEGVTIESTGFFLGNTITGDTKNRSDIYDKRVSEGIGPRSLRLREVVNVFGVAFCKNVSEDPESVAKKGDICINSIADWRIGDKIGSDVIGTVVPFHSHPSDGGRGSYYLSSKDVENVDNNAPFRTPMKPHDIMGTQTTGMVGANGRGVQGPLHIAGKWPIGVYTTENNVIQTPWPLEEDMPDTAKQLNGRDFWVSSTPIEHI
jgi:hypothetical protein